MQWYYIEFKFDTFITVLIKIKINFANGIIDKRERKSNAQKLLLVK